MKLFFLFILVGLNWIMERHPWENTARNRIMYNDRLYCYNFNDFCSLDAFVHRPYFTMPWKYFDTGMNHYSDLDAITTSNHLMIEQTKNKAIHRGTCSECVIIDKRPTNEKVVDWAGDNVGLTLVDTLYRTNKLFRKLFIFSFFIPFHEMFECWMWFLFWLWCISISRRFSLHKKKNAENCFFCCMSWYTSMGTRVWVWEHGMTKEKQFNLIFRKIWTIWNHLSNKFLFEMSRWIGIFS